MDDLSEDDFVDSIHDGMSKAQQTLPPEKLQCSRCGQKLQSKYQLRLHVQEHHPMVHQCQLCSFSSHALSDLREHLTTTHRNSKLACDWCQHVAVSAEALRRHLRSAHVSAGDQQPEKLPPKNFACCYGAHDFEGGCQARFSNRADLRKHLAEQHDARSAEEKIEVSLSSKAEFDNWKMDQERRRGVFYRRVSSRPGQKTLFECSRSGVHAPSGSGRRRLKSQGSSKLGVKCTSTLLMLQHDDGTVTAVLHPHHHGHSEGAANLPHLRIPAGDRAIAKAQLAAGISTARVMRNMRERCGNDSDAGPSRAFWVQRKDIQNICRSIGISAGGDSNKHSNEVVSVRMHAEQLRSSDQHHLLTLKLPDEEGSSGTESLQADDFVFGFCTSHQLKKFVQHGSAVVCMDGTHGTSGEDANNTLLYCCNGLRSKYVWADLTLLALVQRYSPSDLCLLCCGGKH
ncbi:uncharacterized protein LOC122372647 isoform X2 [Amphibalanus amphitrite]|nr:uncharacterized protein LOC122372647 isoform X2 [Amphibalanus amphitrite]